MNRSFLCREGRWRKFRLERNFHSFLQHLLLSFTTTWSLISVPKQERIWANISRCHKLNSSQHHSVLWNNTISPMNFLLLRHWCQSSSAMTNYYWRALISAQQEKLIQHFCSSQRAHSQMQCLQNSLYPVHQFRFWTVKWVCSWQITRDTFGRSSNNSLLLSSCSNIS